MDREAALQKLVGLINALAFEKAKLFAMRDTQHVYKYRPSDVATRATELINSPDWLLASIKNASCYSTTRPTILHSASLQAALSYNIEFVTSNYKNFKDIFRPTAKKSKFNKRVRNKYMGVEKQEQEVNSNKTTKKHRRKK